MPTILRLLIICVLCPGISLAEYEDSESTPDITAQTAVRIAKLDIRKSSLWRAQRRALRRSVRKTCASRRIQRRGCFRKQLRLSLRDYRFQLLKEVEESSIENTLPVYNITLGSKARTQVAEYAICTKLGRILNKNLRPMLASDLADAEGSDDDSSALTKKPVPTPLSATPKDNTSGGTSTPAESDVSASDEESDEPEGPAKAVSGFSSIIYEATTFDCFGSWTEESNSTSFEGTYLRNTSGNASENCQLTFSDVDAGRYEIYIAFPHDLSEFLAYNAQLEILSDGISIYAIDLDQTFNSFDLGINSAQFTRFFSGVLPATPSLTVRIAPADGFTEPVTLDAIYIRENSCSNPVGVVPGDGNLDGKVDAADYTVWRDNLGATFACAQHGDYDGDGDVDVDDYNTWKSNYGRVAPDSPGDFALLEPQSVFSAGLTTLLTPTFTWEESEDAAQYNFKLAESTDPMCNSPIYDESLTETILTLPFELSLGNYTVCLEAVNFSGTTAASNSQSTFEVIEFNITWPLQYLNEPRSTYSWEAAPGASSYIMTLNRFGPTIEDGELDVEVSGTSYTIPESEPGLVNGHHRFFLWAKYGDSLVPASNSPVEFSLSSTRVFLTSRDFQPGGTYPTGFTGLADADDACRQVGVIESEFAFPSQRFVAFMGTADVSVYARMGAFHSPVFDLYGDQIGDNGQSMIDNGLMKGIHITENFTSRVATPWTGAIIGGSIGNTCDRWQSNNTNNYGAHGHADENLTHEFWIGGLPPVLPQVNRCDESHPIFCIGPIPSPLPQQD